MTELSPTATWQANPACAAKAPGRARAARVRGDGSAAGAGGGAASGKLPASRPASRPASSRRSSPILSCQQPASPVASACCDRNGCGEARSPPREHLRHLELGVVRPDIDPVRLLGAAGGSC